MALHFFLLRFDLADQRHRKRRHHLLRIVKLGDGQDRAFGENMLGQFEPHVDPAEHQPRKHPRDQHARKQARQNHEQEIVAGVQGGQRYHENAAEIHHALACQFVIDLIGEPAQRRPPRQNRHDRQRDPTRQGQCRECRHAGDDEMSSFRCRPGIQRQKQRRCERHQRDEETAPAGPVETMPPFMLGSFKPIARPSFEDFEFHRIQAFLRGERAWIL